MAWVPNVAGWIDAKAAQSKARAAAELAIAERLTNDQAYEKIVKVLQQLDDELTECRTDVAILKDWRHGIDRTLRRRHRAGPTDVSSLRGLEGEPRPAQDLPAARARPLPEAVRRSMGDHFGE